MGGEGGGKTSCGWRSLRVQTFRPRSQVVLHVHYRILLGAADASMVIASSAEDRYHGICAEEIKQYQSPVKVISPARLKGTGATICENMTREVMQ